VICGTLVGISTRVNIDHLVQDKEANLIYLEKYAEIGKLLSGNSCEDLNQCCRFIVDKIEKSIQTLQIPKLGAYGFQEGDVEKIVNETGNKSNPVILDNDEIKRIILERI
jgi:alcohol dehydrogenase